MLLLTLCFWNNLEIKAVADCHLIRECNWKLNRSLNFLYNEEENDSREHLLFKLLESG